MDRIKEYLQNKRKKRNTLINEIETLKNEIEVKNNKIELLTNDLINSKNEIIRLQGELLNVRPSERDTTNNENKRTHRGRPKKVLND